MRTTRVQRLLAMLPLAVALGAPRAAAQAAEPPRDSQASQTAREDNHDEIDEAIGGQEFDVPVLPDLGTQRAGGRRAWPTMELQVETSGMAPGDFGSAQVGWARVGGEWEIRIPASKRLGFQLEIGADTAIYDFGGDERFLDAGRESGDPFDELIDTEARLWSRFLLTDSWSLVGGGEIRSRIEEGAPFGSGLEGGGALGGSYRYGDRFDLLVAFGAKSRMHKSGVAVVALVRAGWKINDRFRLRVGLNGGRFSARISDTLQASLFGYVESGRYRLADRNDGSGGVGQGSLRERYAPVGMMLRWKPNERWRLDLSLGSVVYQQLKVYDEDAHSFDGSTLDHPAFFGSLRVKYRFGR